MAIQTFELSKGKTFVAGLFWQTLTRPQKMKEEVRSLALDLDFDFYIVREATVPQVGFLTSSDGAAIGMMSCAAVVSKATDMQGGLGSVLVASKIPDGRYLLVAIRDGAILPECDFIADEDQVEQFYTEQLSIGDWHNRIAPSHWGVDGSRELDFSDLLPTKGKKVQYHKWWEILPVGGDKKKFAIKLGLFAFLIVSGVFSYMKYEQAIANQQSEQQQAIEKAEKAKQLEALNNIQIPRPWLSMPSPYEFMQVCESSFKGKYIFAAGWNLTDFSCSPDGATYNWKRGGTTLAALKQVVPEITSDDIGEIAAMTLPYVLNQPVDEMLLANARDVFIEKLQRVGLKFSMAHVPVVVPTPPDAGPEFIPPVANFKNFHWQIGESALRPITIGGLLDIPGLHITKVFLNAKEGVMNWSYEGEIYENN